MMRFPATISVLCILGGIVMPAERRETTTNAENANHATLATLSSPKQPPREFFGLRLGMNEETARGRLRKIARQEKEEREEEEGGEQEVWIFKHAGKYNYVLAKFSHEHRLTWITVVAHPKRVRYSNVASLDLATRATDGINFSYKWKVEATKQQPGYIIIARGSDAEYLTSYSVYPTR